MRLAVAFAVSTALAIVVACGAGDEGSELFVSDAGSGNVTESYCTKYCNAQASSGTLQGTKAQCLADCCKGVEGGCTGSGDDAPEPDDDDDDDGGPADPTCRRPCGTACCKDDEGCGAESSGNRVCVKTCQKGSDCQSGCCAPATNAKGEAVGPYVCKSNDGQPYHCCGGVFNACDSPNCCVKDGQGNQFCAAACATNATCGAARCRGYEFSAFLTTCGGPTACGPP